MIIKRIRKVAFSNIIWAAFQFLVDLFQALAAVNRQRLCYFCAFIKAAAIWTAFQMLLHQSAGLLSAEALGIQRQKVFYYAAGYVIHFLPPFCSR